MNATASAILGFLQRIKGWRLWLLISLLAVASAELMLLPLDLWLRGGVSRIDLLIALITALVVAPCFILLIKTLLDAFAQQREQVLYSDAVHAREHLAIAVEDAQIVVWQYDFVRDHFDYDISELPRLSLNTDTPPLTLPDWIKLIHEQDKGRFMDKLQAVFQGSTEPFDVEYRVQQSDQVGWVHSRGKVIVRDAVGKPLKAVGLTMNISARKQHEQALREAHASYQALFDKNADVMLVRRVSDQCITDVNEAFCKVTGYSKDEVIGKDTLQLAAWSNPADRERVVDMLLLQGHCENVEADFILRDGRHMFAAVSAVTLMLHGEPHMLATLRDISARKQVEARLQQSEILLRSTLESTDEGVLMVSGDGRVLSANSRFLELWRVPPALAASGQDELLLAHVLEQLCEPDDFMALVRQLYQREDEARDRLCFKDGRVYDRYTRALHVGGQQGRIWCFKDVTGQAHAQAQLAEREEIFHSIVNCANDSILMIDVATQRLVECNDAACRMVEYSREELLQLTVADIQAEYDAQGVSERLRQSVVLGASVFESRHRSKNGRVYAVRISNKALRLHERDYIVAIVSDISERKHLEAELRIAAIAFEAQEGMMITDVNRRILKVNRAFTQITGYSAEEVLGKTPTLLNSGRHDEAFYRAMWQSINCGGAWEGEIWNRRKNGQIYPEHLTITAVADQHGHISHYVGTLTDSTEREDALNKLREAAAELAEAYDKIEEERALLAQRVEERTQQLQHANRAKDAFLATMSHEIRTPLGGLLGMLELLSHSGLQGKQLELFEVAQSSGKNLLHIVDDILDWSKIEAGKMVLAPQATSLKGVLNSVLLTYTQLAAAKHIRLHLSCDSQLSAAHLFDPLRVAQILNNFTSNAIKFTVHGSIELSATLLARQGSCEEVRLSVKDTGVGIARTQQERLFQQYEQASADTARMYGGTGLGLSICRKLAELMEGRLSVESEEGKGSSFHLTLHLAVANPASQDAHSARDVWRESEQLPLRVDGRVAVVLVVDDHPVNRMLLKQQLLLLGLQVQCAASGSEALALWRDGVYDLLISDCHMPEMDGYELTRSIRDIERRELRPRIAVLAWTANVLSEEQQHCAAAGMDAVLTKPTELAELREKLSYWLAQDRVPAQPPPPEAEADDVVIDRQILCKIAKRAADQVDMLREYRVHNRNDIDYLLLALRDANPAAVVRSAQRVKAASHMVGALPLAALCGQIEQSVVQGDMAAARHIAATTLPLALRRLETYLARCVDE